MMFKPLHLLMVLCCAMSMHAQKKDTLVLYYPSDGYALSAKDRSTLDSFLSLGWDRLWIRSFTDAADGEEYNMELSKKRSLEVSRYVGQKKFPEGALSVEYFGESAPVGDNNSEEGRALNRRTELIGYRFPRMASRPREDPAKPVTAALDNGFIITYRPGSLPSDMLLNFEAGSGNNFRVVTNTVQMRQAAMFNNTTRGEILSSVMIICGERLQQCVLDSPIFIKVPIPFRTRCPIEKVKFFNTTVEAGKTIWQEQIKTLYPQTIDGVQYVGIWMKDFCNCINFDFKVDPDCFEMDSASLMYVHANVKNLSAEIGQLNSVYLPREIKPSTHSILYLKDKPLDALVSFSLYNGKRRIKSFYNQLLPSLPYDSTARQYLITTDTVRFYFPDIQYGDVYVRVNGDKYRTFLDDHRCQVIYLRRKAEKITVDLSLMVSRKKLVWLKGKPLSTLPYDAQRGCYIVDKSFLETIAEKTMITMR